MSTQSLVVLPTIANSRTAYAPATELDRPVAAPASRPAAGARSDLFAIVVHELRQPLTVMRGQLQLGQRQIGRDQAREREAMTVAIEQVDRMDKLLTALLDAGTFVSNGLDVRIATFDLVPVVTKAIARHEEGTARSIDFKSPETVRVGGDAERTAEILDNLLGNARKYSPANAPIDVSVAVSGATARVSVSDHGVGVPVAEQARLFTPFYRASTTRDIPGTGLGLHLSKRFAERQGGRLALSASSTSGSTFTLELPLVTGVPTQPAR
ncbi:MAG TPA: HAMP domain-containing sensor histidine kinase [Candidatus Limnocylindria bacterium]